MVNKMKLPSANVWLFVGAEEEELKFSMHFRWFDEQHGETFGELRVPITERQLDDLLSQQPLPCVSGKMKCTHPDIKPCNWDEIHFHLSRSDFGKFDLLVTNLISRQQICVQFSVGFFNPLCQSLGPKGVCTSDITKFLLGEG
jgi:hypothetical protein